MMNRTSSSDRSGPVQYVDTAYDALKYNVPATQQIMQAAQQGQPVGLAGLGAMAAQKFQQQAQQGQQAQQAQQTAMAPSPTVLAQLLNSSGIMGQFQPNLELAQAPTGPTLNPETSQQMAMGGIVALSEGGFIDYGYDGGEGYARGGPIEDDDENDAFWDESGEDQPSLGDVGSGVYGLTPQQMERDRIAAEILKDREDTARKIQARQAAADAAPFTGFFGTPSSDDNEEAKYYETTQGAPSKSIERAPKEKEWAAPKLIEQLNKKEAEPASKAAEPSTLSRAVDALGHLLEPSKAAGAEDTPKAEPSAKAKAPGVKSKNAAHHEENAKDKKYAGTRGTEKTPLAPAAAPVPGEDAIAEHQKEVDAASEASKRGELPPLPPIAPKSEAAPTSTPSQAAPAGAGITSLPVGGELEELQKLYMGDATGELSPETASRLEAMQEQATRDKWLGALTGFGAGMFGAETPYMSQAIASGAMKGLSAYQQGAQNEEQAELRSLQAQMAAEKEPREAQQKALATYVQAQMQQGKSMAEIRKALEVARLNAQTRAQRDQYLEAGKNRRSAAQVGALTGLKEEEIRSRIAGTQSQIEARNIENMSKADAQAKFEIENTVPTPTPEQQQAIHQKWRSQYGIPAGGVGLGGGAGLGGRPMIMGRTGALSTPQ